MRQLLFAAAAALAIAIAAPAFANGSGGASSGGGGGGCHVICRPPGYWTNTSSDQRRYPQTHFLGQGTVFGRIFGHSHAVADKPAATSANGS